MYYNFTCPKCGTVLSEFEEQQEGDNDAYLRLSEMVKQHYATMHTAEDMTDTDEELNYRVKTGMQTSDTKPY
jgi:transcription initiation factor IIE alpha subunit